MKNSSTIHLLDGLLHGAVGLADMFFPTKTGQDYKQIGLASIVDVKLDEPLASCMIVHFSAHISKWELVCKFGVIFHIFIISLPRFTVSCMKLVIFYSIITFSYYKYFVHSYPIDVVFTLSYMVESCQIKPFKKTIFEMKFQIMLPHDFTFSSQINIMFFPCDTSVKKFMGLWSIRYTKK